MDEREPAADGDAVKARDAAQAEEVLGETGALPAESAEESAEQSAPESAGESPEEDVAAVREELEVERRRTAEQLQARARLQADFDNYRKRMLSEQARWRDDAVAQALLQLLPVFDNLKRAAAAEGGGEPLKKGVDLTLRQLADVLRGLGLDEIAIEHHTAFDPNRHEAMGSEESEGHADGEVVTVARAGYTFKGALLRPVLVTVAKAGREDKA